jgi:hypothetical protein
MGEKLPFGFPLDYPEEGGRYQREMEALDAWYEREHPRDNSPLGRKYRKRMARLTAKETWAVEIGRIRRRRQTMLAVAAFFGRRSRVPPPWLEKVASIGGYSFADLKAIVEREFGETDSPGFDREGFQKCFHEMEQVLRRQYESREETLATQLEVDQILSGITRIRGALGTKVYA